MYYNKLPFWVFQQSSKDLSIKKHNLYKKHNHKDRYFVHISIFEFWILKFKFHHLIIIILLIYKALTIYRSQDGFLFCSCWKKSRFIKSLWFLLYYILVGDLNSVTSHVYTYFQMGVRRIHTARPFCFCIKIKMRTIAIQYITTMAVPSGSRRVLRNNFNCKINCIMKSPTYLDRRISRGDIKA